MREWSVLIPLLLYCGLSDMTYGYNWRLLSVGKSTAADAKAVLGPPTHEYREQLLYEDQKLEADDPTVPSVRLDTVVLNLGSDQEVESIFLFPLYGTSHEELLPLFGTGQRMRYGEFLSSRGEFRVGAGTRPDEKLHYVDLNDLCEVYEKSRILVIYERQDVVTGSDLVRLIVFY